MQNIDHIHTLSIHGLVVLNVHVAA